ncbi:MAG: alginate export family protein [Halioglobus sp.]
MKAREHTRVTAVWLRGAGTGLVFMGLSAAAVAQDSTHEGFGQFIADSSIEADFRYRFEHVDQDAFDKDADASTLRSRITLRSGKAWGLSVLGEIDNIAYLGDDDFNSTDNGNTAFPVVADPKGTEVNQLWLGYTADGLAAHIGRQRINHGNQRFIGGVAWRQNEQTYDGARLEWKGLHPVTLDYAYIYNVNRIFGPSDTAAQPGDWRGDNHFIRLDWALASEHKLAVFAYLLDIDARAAWGPQLSVNNSTDTFGLDYAGSFKPFSLKAAYAVQSDSGDSSLNYDARYWMLEGAVDLAVLTALVGYEVLGSDNGVGFKTPLATLHKFQGWADLFLVTPDDGIEDWYLGASGKAGPVTLEAYYHEFKAESSSAEFGSEIDMAATWPVTKRFSTQLTYAVFDADSARYTDTEKVWLTLQFKL